MTDETMRDTARPASRELVMYEALRLIAKGYHSPAWFDANAERAYGLSPREAVEAAYENIQATAAAAIKGMRRPKA